MARPNILRANKNAQIEAIFGDFLEADIAERFIDCDYLFLAADTMRARLLFNAIVHQYLIPGVQVGAKVRVDPKSGEVLDAYCVVRPSTSEQGCLLCNRLINSAKAARTKAFQTSSESVSVTLTVRCRCASVITLKRRGNVASGQ